MEVHAGKIENLILSLTLYSFQFLKDSNLSLKSITLGASTRVFVHIFYSWTFK